MPSVLHPSQSLPISFLLKRGFTNIHRKRVEIVNLRDLARFGDGATIDVASLAACGLVGGSGAAVKLLGDGDAPQGVTVKIHRASASARRKVALGVRIALLLLLVLALAGTQLVKRNRSIAAVFVLDHSDSVTKEQKADYLVRAFRYAKEHWSPWIGLMTVISIADPRWTEDDEQYWWAITEPDWPKTRVRLAYEALREMEK